MSIKYKYKYKYLTYSILFKIKKQSICFSFNYVFLLYSIHVSSWILFFCLYIVSVVNFEYF